MVEVSLTVGKLDASLALLLTKDHHLIEFQLFFYQMESEQGQSSKSDVIKISIVKRRGREFTKFRMRFYKHLLQISQNHQI